MTPLAAHRSRRCCSSRPSRCRSRTWPTRPRPDEQAVARGAERAARPTSQGRGLVLREVGGGCTLASAPGRRGGRAAAARRARARRRSRRRRPRRCRSSPTCSRSRGPEIARIRGVAVRVGDRALVERGLIEEAGRSQFGAVLYRTTPLFLKLFGLRSLEELPDLAQWDPSPEEQAALRDRLLRAGEERTGAAPIRVSVARSHPGCRGARRCPR